MVIPNLSKSLSVKFFKAPIVLAPCSSNILEYSSASSLIPAFSNLDLNSSLERNIELGSRLKFEGIVKGEVELVEGVVVVVVVVVEVKGFRI